MPIRRWLRCCDISHPHSSSHHNGRPSSRAHRASSCSANSTRNSRKAGPLHGLCGEQCLLHPTISRSRAYTFLPLPTPPPPLPPASASQAQLSASFSVWYQWLAVTRLRPVYLGAHLRPPFVNDDSIISYPRSAFKASPLGGWEQTATYPTLHSRDLPLFFLFFLILLSVLKAQPASPNHASRPCS